MKHSVSSQAFRNILCHNCFMKWNEKLKEARIAKNLSQLQLSQLLGVTRACYANYEQGTREPSLAIMLLICKNLDISADYLIGLSDF